MVLIIDSNEFLNIYKKHGDVDIFYEYNVVFLFDKMSYFCYSNYKFDNYTKI